MSEIRETSVPFEDGFTWVRTTVPDVPIEGMHPLVVLHGGPGMAHDYVRNIAELADETGRTVVHYDQFGCGRSSHRPDAGRAYWTPELFVREFGDVVRALGLGRVHVLGQSWGGMLGAEIAVARHPALVSLAICNSPASMELWMDGAARLRAELPAAARDALDRHEADGTLEDPDYLAATAEFYRRHVCRTERTPQDFLDSEWQMEEEPTVYHTMNGPNEFHVVGTLRDWTIVERLDRIDVPVLVVAGEFDEATAETWRPFVDRIPDASSRVFADASHCTHLERPREFRDEVAAFFAQHD